MGCEPTERGINFTFSEQFGNDVRTWQEDESPYKLITDIVKDRGVRHRRVGIEERVRFFIADGIRKASSFELADATPVTAGCRMYKTASEIALMQRANDVTIEAYKAAFTTMKPGMTQGDLSANIAAAFKALGYSGGASAQFGIYTAFPHGSATRWGGHPPGCPGSSESPSRDS